MDVSGIGLITAFLAGVVSFLSPCVLPLVPGYVSYVAGRSIVGPADETVIAKPPMGLSLFFVLGFSTVFIALGASATMLGQVLLSYRYEANLVGGAVVILFGFLMTGIVRLPSLQREFRLNTAMKGGHPAAAYVLG